METSAEHKDNGNEAKDAPGKATEEGATPAKEGAAEQASAKDESVPAEKSAAEHEGESAKSEADTEETKDEGDANTADKAKPRAKVTPVRRGVRGPGAARVSAAPKKGGSLGKSLALFVLIVGGLAAGFAILGREDSPNAPPAKPKWSAGQEVDVDITLVKTDRSELGCASAEEIGDKRCGFDGTQKPRTISNDKSIFKPYTTTDRIQFLGAGLWDSLGASNLPATRFSAKCKYKVEGTLKKVDVRWESTGPWYPVTDWYAGSLSACKITP
jgi:hypothetical protein